MDHHVLIGLGSILVLGIAAQWVAWRLRLPSILVLLLAGFLAGPVTGFLDPDALLGDLLPPVVSISVAIILFEGGLSLKLPELSKIGGTVRRLVTVGVLITWVLGTVAGYTLLGLDFSLAVLLGAILTVTGPTVVIPLLRDIRAEGRVRAILRWEGILIDPIGVMLAVLVFEAIAITDLQVASTQVLTGFLLTLLVGFGLGGVLAIGLTAFLRRYWIPEYLQNAVVVMVVVGAFVVSDLIRSESGLLTATVMGIVMANQKMTPIKHIVEFKENLGVMLISNLFILLAARLELDALAHVSLETVLFVAFLMLIVRPLVVAVSTLGSGLKWQEKAFIAWLAPRGIVAAASASIFTLELSHTGHPQAELLTPITFTVIVVTVAVYGLSARPVSRWLGVSQGDPQGILFVGAHPWARAIAKAVQDLGFQVLMVDSNWANIQQARMQGLPTYFGNILQEDIDALDLSGIGRLLAVTSNDEVNSLAALHFTGVFGRSGVYQLPCRPAVRSDAVPQHLRGRLLFGSEATYPWLNKVFSEGMTIKTTPLTESFSFKDWQTHYNGTAVPFFLKDDQGDLQIFTTDRPPLPRAGSVVLSAVQAGFDVEPVPSEEPVGNAAAGAAQA